MGNLPPRGVRIRRERIGTLARVGWLLLCAFIVYGSRGTWAASEPRIWAPTMVSGRDVAVNVLLYVPFGALGVLALRDRYALSRSTGGADGGPPLRLVLRLVVLAIVFSAANESLQLYTIDRVASLTDIVSAAAGAAIGSALLTAGRLRR